MSALDTPFLVGQIPTREGPLSRFLPPLEDGMAAQWLTAHAPPGSWVLDPFGAAPRLAAEAARAGYRVLVTANNPIARLLLDVSTAPPTEAELKAALADLAVTKKGDERLENHIQSLYLTQCSNCEAETPAQAFLWKKGADAPYARLYQCPACGEGGREPVTPLDVERAQKMAETAGLHRARLLERVAPPGDPDREYAEEALSVYQPRAIYALATLINRLDAAGVTPERRRLLSALFLSACDAANNLWRVDNERPRPRLLSVSNEFRENNVWMALEAAIAEWSAQSAPLPCVTWPNKIPESGGVILFDGRIAELAALLLEAKNSAPISAVVTALPRPNQAYWTLCALWAGWLWGRDAAESFKSVLRRRRYDWGWHLEALNAAHHHLFELLKPGTPYFGLLPEPEPSFLTAALAAGDNNGFQLSGLAMRTQHDAIQIHWRRAETIPLERPALSPETIRTAIHTHLGERGEPALYLHLHAAALTALTEKHALIHPQQPEDEVIRAALEATHQALLDDETLIHYRGSESAESGLWGLKPDSQRVEPISDRVEMVVVNHLIWHPDCTFEDVLRETAEKFPGLLTPSMGLVGETLVSYAEQSGGCWRMREEDHPSARKEELLQIAKLIETIGERLEFRTRWLDERTLVWEEGESSEYAFYLKASAIMDETILQSRAPHKRCVVALPAGRASLLAYKLGRDPALAARLEGLHFVKFRLLRAIATLPVLNRQIFEKRLISDPLVARTSSLS